MDKKTYDYYLAFVRETITCYGRTEDASRFFTNIDNAVDRAGGFYYPNKPVIDDLEYLKDVAVTATYIHTTRVIMIGGYRALMDAAIEFITKYDGVVWADNKLNWEETLYEFVTSE